MTQEQKPEQVNNQGDSISVGDMYDNKQIVIGKDIYVYAKTQSNSTHRRVTIVVFFATLLVFLDLNWYYYYNPIEPKMSDVRVVDYSFIHIDIGQVLIDIKMINRGKKTAFLKRVNLEIIEKTRMRYMRCDIDETLDSPRYIPISATYTMELAENIEVGISHEIRADETDRFDILLVGDINKPRSFGDRMSHELVNTRYDGYIDIIYDEDDKVISIPFYLCMTEFVHNR